MLRGTVPAASKKDAIMEFSIIYINYQGKYIRKPVGSVNSLGKGKDSYSALEMLNMKIGDAIDVSIKTSTP